MRLVQGRDYQSIRAQMHRLFIPKTGHWLNPGRLTTCAVLKRCVMDNTAVGMYCIF